MAPFDEVKVLWDEHLNAPFPDGLVKGEEIAGVEPVMLDSDIAGCVSTWLHNHGRLDDWRKGILAECLDDLDKLLPFLQDDGPREYFTRLRRLAELTLT